MKTVECKECGIPILAKYEPIFGNSSKEFADVKQVASEDVNTAVYLTCDNEHTNKYYCKIKL